MKLLIATGLYTPDIGGPATYTTLLEADLPQHDVEVTVVPFTLVRRYPKLIRHVVYGWRVWQAARSVDIIYALDPISVGLPALFAAKLRRTPFLLRLGGDYAWEQGRIRFGVTQTLDGYVQNPTGRPLPVRLLAALQTYVARNAVTVIAPSQYLKRIITQWGIDPATIAVIYSTLVPLVSTQSAADTRRAQSLEAPVLVTAGRLVPWKGMLAVIAVVRQLRHQYPTVTLLIVGDGPQLGELQSYVAKHQLDQHVRFLGRQSKTELANTVKSADVFILNTAYEGLSHQLLEVMDLGVPIVTTNNGGNTELLSDGVDSFLVPFNDQSALQAACERLLQYPATAAQLVQFARARTKDFSRQRAVEQFVTLIQRIHHET